MNSTWALPTSRFGAMDVVESVEFFRRLLCAEATRLAVAFTSVHVPQAPYVKDGGIDASFDPDPAIARVGLIAQGQTRYQLKTGNSFKPWQNSELAAELFGKGESVSRDNLGTSVRACLEKGGRYVLIAFGHELEGTKRNDAKDHLIALFEKCGFRNPSVDVWGQNQLVSLAQQFPGLVRSLISPSAGEFLDWRSWTQSEVELGRPFFPGDAQKEFIQMLQAALRGDDRAHVRVLGDAGIGKTRLVMEATAVDDLSPLVVYGNAEKLVASQFLHEIVADPSQHAIIVADDCDEELRSRLANRLGSQFPRIRVVSLFHSIDRSSGCIRLDVPPLPDDQIAEIISDYNEGAPQAVSRQYARLCSGSPRVAHVIGQNLASNPNDLLAPLSTYDIWERYICGGLPKSDPLVTQSRIVLRHLALFSRFGFNNPVADEAKAIATMCQEADPSITWSRFREIVAYLRDRKILQGVTTLYITPLALQIRLWCDYWNVYLQGFSLPDFRSRLTGKLFEWFVGMIRYAHQSQAATAVVRQLLGPSGPFADGNLLTTEDGSDFFDALTEADPEAALESLERTVGAWSHEELLGFTTGRRSTIFALEKIVVWHPLFQRGARLLLRLAAAENESWGNNATGVFAGLFTCGYGPVSPTEAAPRDRFPVLKDALESKDPMQRAVGRKAAAEALKTRQISRMAGAEFQGIRPPANLWIPKDWGEIDHALTAVWRLLDELTTKSPPQEAEEIADILLRSFPGLAESRISSICIATVRQLVVRRLIAAKQAIDTFEDALTYGQNLTGPDRDAIESAWKELVGEGFRSQIRRFVGINRHEDYHNSGQGPAGNVEERLDRLAEHAMENPIEVLAELDWLTTADAERGFEFGRRLAERDPTESLLNPIAAKYQTTREGESLALLGGYLSAIFHGSTARWEAILDEFDRDPNLARNVVELTWWSGMTPNAAARIERSVRRGATPVIKLSLFRYGQLLRKVPELVIWNWISLLFQAGTLHTFEVAIELVFAAYQRGDDLRPLPTEKLEPLIFRPELVQSKGPRRSHAQHLWAKLAQEFVEALPDRGPPLLDLILTAVGDQGSIAIHHRREMSALCRAIISLRPNEAWIVIQKHLENPSELFWITDWLSGGLVHHEECALWDVIPMERFWSWIAADPKSRPWRMCRSLPKTLDNSPEGMVTGEFLIRFGDDPDVTSSLSAHFWSGTHWGKSSDHYAEQLNKVLTWRQSATHPNVVRFLDEHAKSLRQSIARERIEEERRGW